MRLVEAVGNCSTMLQFWVDSGLNGLYFAEAAAGLDARLLRLKYGTELAIIGNVDSQRLIAGRREIREELESKVPALCDEGGYIPVPRPSRFWRGVARELRVLPPEPALDPGERLTRAWMAGD